MKHPIRFLPVAIVGLLGWSTAGAAPVDLDTAAAVAEAAVRHRESSSVPTPAATVEAGGAPLVYLFELEPSGFVIVAGDDDLPPVIAYSLMDPLPTLEPEREILHQLLRLDLTARLERPAAAPENLREQWSRLLAGNTDTEQVRGPQQWPPAGTTATGGWLEANWHQGAPYNDQCPLDPVSGGRSVAGCPSVAMALIVDFHKNTNGAQLDETDDYYHSYDGRQYWIDDDWATIDFPSFPTLSASLSALEEHYRQQIPTTDADAAALVFACGVAAKQVYTASVSGTFGVQQAVDAYTRFGITGFELLNGTEPDLHDRLLENMQQAQPAHLAVLQTGGGGHNLVIDGADSDGYYHLNFGWGGQANGWYLIPDEIPYNLNTYEGIIVDITVPLFADGFETGDTQNW